MARPVKLDDLDLILLSTASARESGLLHPLRESIRHRSDAVEAAIAGLLRRRLVEKGAVTDRSAIWKEEGGERIGLVLTPKARALIDGEAEASCVTDEATPVAAPRSGSKSATVLAMLGREGGASPAELIDATGWLPHTMRAALSGLRRKGHAIGREKRGEVAVYRLVTGA